jgi:hypothetical protein
VYQRKRPQLTAGYKELNMRALFPTVLSLFSFALLPDAHAGTGATLVFREGQVVYLDDGYATLVEAYKNMDKHADSRKIIEMTLNGSSFLLDLSQVVIVCRDKCASIQVVDPRKSGRQSQ